jgi:hypothetical protein
VIPQLDYIGSQYKNDFFNKKIKEGQSTCNFMKETQRKHEWLINEETSE